MAIFFSADTHFNHANIIKFCKRPYGSVSEMNNALIRNWNARVGQNDLVYHVGDFSFGDLEDWKNILLRLNGEIHLIKGNHDQKTLKRHGNPGFASMQDYLEISVEKQKIIMFHYALRVWDASHYGSWSLYGHSHGKLEDLPDSKSCDVGVDAWGYAPVSFHELKAHMSTKTPESIAKQGKGSKG